MFVTQILQYTLSAAQSGQHYDDIHLHNTNLGVTRHIPTILFSSPQIHLIVFFFQYNKLLNIHAPTHHCHNRQQLKFPPRPQKTLKLSLKHAINPNTLEQ
jgi:hypothetical protein